MQYRWNNRQAGMALVMVLWAVVLLAVMAGGVSYTLRLESRITGNYLAKAKADALAEGGVFRGIQGLLERNAELRWRTDGEEYEMEMGGGIVYMSLMAENGKVDLNVAPAALITGLIEVVDNEVDADSITAAILDWRDADQERRPNGAEDSDYHSAALGYGARDAPLVTVGELQQVLGITPVMFRDLLELVTVHSGMAGVDPMAAPKEVLLGLPGLDEVTVEAFLAAREQTGADEDGQRARSLLSVAKGYLAPSGTRFYTVRARAALPNGGVSRRQALVRINRNQESPYSILAWKNDQPAVTVSHE